MKINRPVRAIISILLWIILIPISAINAHATAPLPPADLVFQLPWDQGVAWMAVDGLDYGLRRPANSPHNYLNGGAVDFAPRREMRVGEDTSNYWVTAAAAGKIIEKSACHVKIDHLNGWITEYQFLGNIQVKLGDVVYRNQRLGIIADGLRHKFCAPALEPDMPHLHFTLRPNMRGATFAGWTIKYDSWFNITRFTKNNQTVGLYQPLLNTLDLQIVLRETLAWDTLYTGTVDSYHYERWPFALTERTNFTVTVTPTTVGLLPDVVLLDGNGNELTRAAGALISTQAAGNYFVQVQPQIGNGFYNIQLHNNGVPNPTGPYISVIVVPNIQAGETVLASANLNNVPADGYTSAEFACNYDATLISISNIAATGLFGADPAVAVNGPTNGTFIVAIAGSHGNKVTTSGPAFTFNVTGLQAGQTQIACTARVSSGNNSLTAIESVPATVSVDGVAPTPTPPPSTPTPEPTLPPPPIAPVIAGQILASKVVTIRLMDPVTETVLASVNANPDGTFRFDLPASGTYMLMATANGFMRLQGTFNLINGEVRTLPAIGLLAGDIDDNGLIDQFDAMTIGFAYNTAEPPGADLNSDGIINVLDLEMLAANYRKAGPVIWQP